MMKKSFTFIILLLIISQTNSYLLSQDNPRKYEGSWLGSIDAGGMSLRLVFNISFHAPDSLSAKMDSPDQGAKNIPMGRVKGTSDSLKIFAPFMGGKYLGRMVNDSSISGNWFQAGRSFKLELKRQKEKFTVKRPQEPVGPVPYKTVDVKFRNSSQGITLAGTIFIPEGEGVFPAVIFISGSGAQDRNESLMGHKPFLVMADWLARNGIASLRYDDRGVAGSEGDYSAAATADLATDALAALEYLKTVASVKKDAIGFAGHSEGGLIAPLAAAGRDDVAFIVSLAGPGVKGEQILYTQAMDIGKASGVSEKELKRSISLNRKLYGAVMKENDDRKAEETVIEILGKSLDKRGVTAEEKDAAIKSARASFGAESYRWFRYFLQTDPAEYWSKVTCPVLALNGEKDLQVSSAVNLPAIEKALKKGGNTRYRTVSFPRLNHLFQNCETGSPSEYGKIEETVSEEVLKTISEWIMNLTVSP